MNKSRFAAITIGFLFLGIWWYLSSVVEQGTETYAYWYVYPSSIAVLAELLLNFRSKWIGVLAPTSLVYGLLVVPADGEFPVSAGLALLSLVVTGIWVGTVGVHGYRTWFDKKVGGSSKSLTPLVVLIRTVGAIASMFACVLWMSPFIMDTSLTVLQISFHICFAVSAAFAFTHFMADRHHAWLALFAFSFGALGIWPLSYSLPFIIGTQDYWSLVWLCSTVWIVCGIVTVLPSNSHQLKWIGEELT